MWCLLLVVSTLPDNNWPDAASFAIYSLFEHFSTCSSKFRIAGNLWLMAALCAFLLCWFLENACIDVMFTYFWFYLLCQTTTEQMKQILPSVMSPLNWYLTVSCQSRWILSFLFIIVMLPSQDMIFMMNVFISFVLKPRPESEHQCTIVDQNSPSLSYIHSLAHPLSPFPSFIFYLLHFFFSSYQILFTHLRDEHNVLLLS